MLDEGFLVTEPDRSKGYLIFKLDDLVLGKTYISQKNASIKLVDSTTLRVAAEQGDYILVNLNTGEWEGCVCQDTACRALEFFARRNLRDGITLLLHDSSCLQGGSETRQLVTQLHQLEVDRV